MYRNDAYSNKWFYAFITDMEYLNDNVTAITIKTDVWQTWQFDLSYKPTFIEREHVNDDTFGRHTIREGLDVGEYVAQAKPLEIDYNSTFWLAFQVTELISNMQDVNTGGRIYNGIYNGLIVVLVDNYRTADLLVSAYDDAGKHDSIISCFYVPKRLVVNPYINSGVTLHGEQVDIYFPRATQSYSLIDRYNIDRPSTLDGYTPKNNKMFTKEFCYLYATNNSGVDVTYSFEDWRNDGTSLTTASFDLIGSLSQGCSIKLFPTNYYLNSQSIVGVNDAGYSHGVNAGKLPLCSWNSDYYTNWVTQNSVNIGVGVASSVLNAGANLASGNVVGMASSLLSGIGGIMGEKYKASLVPNQGKGNVNTGDLNFSKAKGITLIPMGVRREYAIICDSFLSMFGYKVNAVKTPNITGRRNWNFVKTQGCYIQADIPQSDLQEIKNMFNNGITLWHNPNTFADYSQNNDII